MSCESRLQKLLHLLENATEHEVRDAASHAIRDIAAAHPHQLPFILQKVKYTFDHSSTGNEVCALLRRRQWECRAAAGLTLGLLAQRFCHHSVNDLRRLCQVDESGRTETGSPVKKKQKREKTTPFVGPMSAALAEFDVERVIEKGTLLVACAPKLDVEGGSSIEEAPLSRSMSTRERNQLKRKQRSYERKHLLSPEESSDPSPSQPERSDSLVSVTSESDVFDEKTEDFVLDGDWPFMKAFEMVLGNMMHPVWEVRHGAVLGLRELLSSQALSAGVKVTLVQDVPSGWAVPGKTSLRDAVEITEEALNANISQNRICLEECCVKILELLVLDRMGDYLTDKMIAPVRETAAQAFGCCLSALPTDTIRQFLSIIDQMICNAAWEVRHSGYVLLKYLSTTQKELTVADARNIFECVLSGLQDAMDDVRAAAADVLLPIASSLSCLLSSENMSALRNKLWSNLEERDDLSSATPSILHLLWKLYTCKLSKAESRLQLKDQLPLLFPFFAHPLAAVRMSAVRCFRQLLSYGADIRSFFLKASFLIFCNLLTEVKEENLQLNEDTWCTLLKEYGTADLVRDYDDTVIGLMLNLASTPIGATFELSSLEYFMESIEDHCGEKLVVGSQFAGNPFRMRLAVCRALALLFRRLSEDRQHILVEAAQSKSATSQLVAALICHFWQVTDAKQAEEVKTFPQICESSISDLLDADDHFSELAGHETKLRKTFSAFVEDLSFRSGYNIAHAVHPADIPPEEVERCSSYLLSTMDPTVIDTMTGLQQHLTSTAETVIEMRQMLSVQIHACAAAVLVDTGVMPSKMNRIVQPLMAGVRTERDILLQTLFAEQLARLIALCRQRKASAARMIENVCTMACEGGIIHPAGDLLEACEKDGISIALGVVSSDASQMHVSRRGAEFVLRALAHDLSADLLMMLPSLRAQMEHGLTQSPMQAVRSLEIVQTIGPDLSAELLPQLSSLLLKICHLCVSRIHGLRVSASRCCARLVSAHTDVLFPVAIEELVPFLTISCDISHREGALIATHHMLESLGVDVVPYIVLLIVPLLELVSDYTPSVRLIAASCFGRLTALLPLMPSFSAPCHLSPAQQRLLKKNGDFVGELMHNKKLTNIKIPVTLPVELRDYQKEGVCWMSFLRRFGLHGILADDMGLGKTIQTLITIVLSKYEKSGKVNPVMPSLVVCPATLIQHWCSEVASLLPAGSLFPMPYTGVVGERAKLRQHAHNFDLVVMSYEALRTDIDWVTSQTWNYCILDEGHVIRNSESKIWKACKRVRAEHRLILSGTPVQNGVLELWALFDFLIPGFLGTKKDFMSQYGKAVHAARYARKGSVESTSSDLALTSLHKRVTPFIMRRTKDEVLHDLPPKIIQDIYCDLSSIQKSLYEDFEKAQKAKEKESVLRSSFESFQYLRQLCSHPMLVFDWQNAAHRSIARNTLGTDVSGQKLCEEALMQPMHAPKLQILQELFSECGICSSQSPLADEIGGSHRMLIFAQTKGMLTIMERQLLLPLGIPHLRLDGAVPTHERGHIVRQFNSDPTIGVLLLTTKVGGLGLNLTSADVVVFLEHDWNPMTDLQAMDRAHRLGQKRTVNVYRILTRGTLEEKIMSLQHFKKGVANSVINKDNISLDSMDTSCLLDLFSYEEKKTHDATHPDAADDEYARRYEEEFDMEKFSKRVG